MKKYNRVMLGQGSKFAKMCREEGYIGAEFDIFVDLSNDLYENWRDFNKKFIPIWMNNVQCAREINDFRRFGMWLFVDYH